MSDYQIAQLIVVCLGLGLSFGTICGFIARPFRNSFLFKGRTKNKL